MERVESLPGWSNVDLREKWIFAVWLAIPFAVALGVLVQRHQFTHPGRDTLFVAGALLPPTADLLGLRWPRFCVLPMLPQVIIVTACTLGLLWHATNVDVAPFFLVLVTGEAALMSPRRDGVIAFVLTAGTMIGVQIAGRFDGAYIWVVGIALGWFTGAAIRYVLSLLDDLEHAQHDLAERAAADERRRIAREVHDVLAHSLTVTMLHVTGARRALARDPEEARAALEEAERLGRQSLGEVRRVVGLLDPDGSGVAPPMPCATDVPELVDQFRAAGLDVTLQLEGDLTRVAPASGLALYRITQESLTNVTKHVRDGSARVHVAVHNGTVRLVVANSGTPDAGDAAPGTRRGITGMRERAASLGGNLHAGPCGSEAWRVEAEIPTAPA